MTRGQGWMAGAVLLLLAACGAAGADGPEAAAPERLRLERVSADPVQHGERLSKVLGCAGCHDPGLTGRDWSEADHGPLHSANLTRSAQRWSETELTQMIVAGRRPDRALLDMPSHVFARLHPEDVAAVVAYLKTLAPTGPVYPEARIGPRLQERIDAGEYRNAAQLAAEEGDRLAPDLGPRFAQARQLVSVTCAECHGDDLRGMPAPERYVEARPDLRMVAAYDPADFATLLRTGIATGGREVGLMTRSARRRYAYLTDGEVAALRAYLVELARRDP